MKSSSKNLFQRVLQISLITELSIICLLVISSLFISYVLQSNSPFFLQENTDEINFLTPYHYDLIQKGQKVRLESTVHYSYFGILSMRFNTFNRLNADSLIFRIKEKGSKDWYYQNRYKTDQFQNNQLFPFGFPPINTSRDKTYVYEIESVGGNAKDGVALSQMRPIISATFQYSSTRILTSGLEGLMFVLLKYIHGLESLENVPAILSPFIIYVFYKRFSQKGNQEKMIKLTFLVLSMLSIFYIVFLGKILPGSQTNSIGILVALLIFWGVFVLRYRVKSNFWLMLAVFSILCMSVVVFFRRPDLGERAGALAYGFMLIGILQTIIELKFSFYKSRTMYDVLALFVPEQYSRVIDRLVKKIELL